MNFFRKTGDYFKESYNELVHKVSWPTQQELSSSTIVVMSASLIFALVIFAIDFLFENVIKFFYSNIF
ncbi:MAG: preprotein translocase subunit SecE [Dysgonamonadaceae bacterium]|jgi:preprotein translocase subunit SecE|nr:preprotein translocase subunit SecE [Dysgonamonadaceae bacterium]